MVEFDVRCPKCKGKGFVKATLSIKIRTKEELDEECAKIVKEARRRLKTKTKVKK